MAIRTALSGRAGAGFRAAVMALAALLTAGVAGPAGAAGAAGAAGPAPAGPAGPAWPDRGDRWSLEAPGDGPRASIALDPGGRLSLTVHDGDAVVLEPSALGVRTAELDFTTGLRFTGISQRTIREPYTTLGGKRREHLGEAQETTLHLRKAGRPMDVVLRVAPDGVAYRYVFPGDRWVTVLGEASEFAVPARAQAVLLPWDNGRDDYESIHIHTTVAEAPPAQYGYPALFRVDASWLLVTESDLNDNYGGSRLTLDATSRKFQLTLPDPAEVSRPPAATPWRTMVVGDLAAVVESDLVADLAAPSKVADTSWIKPGAAAWSWWAEGGSSNNLARQQAYVDLAARNGWEYNVVDAGWSAGLIPPLVQYAKERGIGIWIWVRWQQLDAQSERDRLFTQYRDWGVVGLKIDFAESDGQDRMRWYQAVLTDAARYRLMLNFHGGTIPRGWERTWPHLLTMESVRGGEGTRPNPTRVPYPASHYLTVPFTRNVIGSMDWTPVTFGGVRPTSDAHELALAVIYESALQNWSDSPERYAAYPLAERFLKVAPVVWDDTRLLSGQPGDHIVLARRHGDDWFVGAGTAGAARTLDVGLDFLPPGEWLLDLYHDGAERALTLTTRTADRTGRLTQAVADNGGFIAHFCPARPGRTTCAAQ